MTSKEILQQEFDLIAIDLIAKHNELGMKASGNWVNSIETKVSSNEASILGEDYTEQLEYGRGATSAKGSGVLIDKIKQWVLDKGLTYDIPLNSLAFLIARKIHKEGWKRKQHGGVELVSQVLTPKRINDIIIRVGNEMTLEVVELISKTYQTA